MSLVTIINKLFPKRNLKTNLLNNKVKEISALEVGKRLRNFAIDNFGSIENLAKVMGVTSTTLKSNYISGRSIPGGAFLFRLYRLGCDINWLLSGVETSDLKKFNEGDYNDYKNLKMKCIEMDLLLKKHIEISEKSKTILSKLHIKKAV